MLADSERAVARRVNQPAAMRSLVMTVAVSVVAACGGGNGETADADPNAPDAAASGRCEDRDLYAQFRVSPEPGASGRYGSQGGGWVTDGRAPEIDAVIDTDGACRFVAPQPALCTPACSNGEVCDIHGQCALFPTHLPAGTVTIAGTSPTLVLEPQLGDGYYAQMPYPGLFGAGDALTLDVEGDTGIAPYQLATVGIPALTMATEQFTAIEDQDLVIGWDAVAGLPGTEIIVELHNDHHAGPEYVQCTADASLGAVTVPASILDQLIVAGESGIGTYIESAWIELRHRGFVTDSRGCAAFDSDSDHFLSIDTVRAP